MAAISPRKFFFAGKNGHQLTFCIHLLKRKASYIWQDNHADICHVGDECDSYEDHEDDMDDYEICS